MIRKPVACIMVLCVMMSAIVHAAPVVKNVVLLVGDGMGYNQVIAGNYYRYGAETGAVFESFPVKYGMSTFEYGKGYDPVTAWADFNYVKQNATDSASASTAMSTAIKTYNGAIGVNMGRMALNHLISDFLAIGKAAGVVSSVPFSHATPAGFVAHNVSRNNYHAIAHEMINSDLDVIIGAGHPWYNDNAGLLTKANYKYINEADYNALVAGTAGAGRPWHFIDTKEGLEDVANGAASPDRLFGLARVASTFQQSRSGDVKAGAYAVPQNTGIPSLAIATTAALRTLAKNSKGFFIMVEGGAIDWASHGNQSGRLVEEQLEFVDAVQAAVDWVNQYSNWDETVIIVTADHECGYLTGPNSGPGPVWNPIANNGAGNMPGMEWHSTDHTNALVPVYAKGPNVASLSQWVVGADPVRGNYIDNTGLANWMRLNATDTRRMTGSVTTPGFVGQKELLGLLATTTAGVQMVAVDPDGTFTVMNMMDWAIRVLFSASRFLSVAHQAVVAGGDVHGVNLSLTSGDADLDNQITLMDYLIIDAAFGNNEPAGDMDGDGQVTLFDYLVIDRVFGARGDD